MGKGFRILIVDDEEWALKGIVGIIESYQPEFEIIGQYTDSRIALDKVRELEPDVVLLDIKMPYITGEMMMEIIREEGIPCELIVISGYSDFSITKQAIQQKAFDYILKPIDRNEINKTMDRLYKHLVEKNKRAIKVPVDPTNPKIFENQDFKSKIEEMCHYQYYQIILANKDQVNNPDPITEVVLSEPVNVYGARTMWLAASNHKEAMCVKADLEDWALQNQIAVGVSKPGKSMDEFHNMFRQANCALCSVYIQEKNDAFFYASPDLIEVQQWLDMLKSAYNSNNQEIVRNAITHLINAWRLDGNPASISMLIKQLTYEMGSQGRINDTINIEKFLYDDITSQFYNMDEIIDYLFKMSGNEGIFDAENSTIVPEVILDIKEYLSTNYSDDLNLARLSNEFYLSPTYLCEIFKRYTGETITNYLLKIRMENASRLLATTDMPLTAISGEVGYNDYNYFSRLFKRYFGVSPGYYRKPKHN